MYALFLTRQVPCSPRVVYAEKAEAEASKDAKIFNCAQRAHQNTLESVPVILVTYAAISFLSGVDLLCRTLVSGLAFPLTAASLCATFVVGRISYTRNYVTGDPEKVSHLIRR